jgi:hypothetical protein
VTAHFLHIGKTGGSAIKAALRPFRKQCNIAFHPHWFATANVPAGERFFFCVRDPVSRFISAFNSRLRMGRPAGLVPWDADEEWAFARFQTPDALAAALGATDPAEARQARRAMRSIRHVRQHQNEWFPAPAENSLQKQARRVLWIGFQESLDADFELLKSHMKLSADVFLPLDNALAHRAPENCPTVLTGEGRRNIAAWYAEDVRFVAALRELRNRW